MLVQIIPVAQIGGMLSSNQWAEELPHNCESGIDDACVKAFLPVTLHGQVCDTKAFAALLYIHSSEQIPSNHSTDVVSPPPDVIV